MMSSLIALLSLFESVISVFTGVCRTSVCKLPVQYARNNRDETQNDFSELYLGNCFKSYCLSYGLLFSLLRNISKYADRGSFFRKWIEYFTLSEMLGCSEK